MANKDRHKNRRKRRNELTREMIESGRGNAGPHHVDHSTAYRKGFRRHPKHKRDSYEYWDDDDE